MGKEDYWWYLETRRYGVPCRLRPGLSGGYVYNRMKNIRDVILSADRRVGGVLTKEKSGINLGNQGGLPGNQVEFE